VLDVLTSDIPESLQSEIRLGLQEALVNAAKHGNQLDPSKQVFVRFSMLDSGHYWWVISDQGGGFELPPECHAELHSAEVHPLEPANPYSVAPSNVVETAVGIATCHAQAAAELAAAELAAAELAAAALETDPLALLPGDEGECGRGLFILHQVFDSVQWCDRGRELKLCKKIARKTAPRRRQLLAAALNRLSNQFSGSMRFLANSPHTGTTPEEAEQITQNLNINVLKVTKSTSA
jgi:anti-sigma regulatory factor (Ser/Thr protein kinase)